MKSNLAARGAPQVHKPGVAGRAALAPLAIERVYDKFMDHTIGSDPTEYYLVIAHSVYLARRPRTASCFVVGRSPCGGPFAVLLQEGCAAGMLPQRCAAE